MINRHVSIFWGRFKSKFCEMFQPLFEELIDGESGDKFLNLNDEEREVVKRANLKLSQKVGFFQCKLFLTSSYLVPLLFK